MMNTDNFSGNTPTKKQQLAFVIAENDYFGMIFEAYIVELNNDGRFSYSYKRISNKTIDDYYIEFSRTERELIQLLDLISEESIVKKFSKQQLKPNEFFPKLEQNKFSGLILPYIEKTLAEFLNILNTNNFPLYFKGKKKNPIQDEAIEIFKNPTEVIFNFEKLEGETHYFLTIQKGNEIVSLTNKEAAIICSSPCWILMKNQLFCFEENIDANKLLPFFNKNFIIVPEKSEKEYFQSFIQKAIKRNCKINNVGFKIEEITSKPFAKLSLELNSKSEPILLLSFTYSYSNVLFHKKDEILTEFSDKNGFSFKKIIRDFYYEEQQKLNLLESGLSFIENSTFILESMDESPASILDLVDWLCSKKQILQEFGFEIEQKSLNNQFFLGKSSQKVSINKNNDWFDLEITVSFGHYVIPFKQLKHHILNNIREFILPSGEIAVIPNEWFAKFNDVAIYGTSSNESLKLSKHHFSLLSNLLDNEVPDFLKRLQNLTTPDKIKTPPLSAKLKSTMRDYQVKGFSWMNFLQVNNMGGILADDMGLGKTIQTIAILESLKNSNTEIIPAVKQTGSQLQLSIFDSYSEETSQQPQKTSLIVMPLSLIHNWENEFRKFAPDLKIHKHIGINRSQSSGGFSKYDVVLSTYGTVRNDIEFISNFQFHYLILDESQIIKNPFSKNYAAIKQVNSLNKLVLTGTPIENHLVDLWSQFSILNPGLLGSLNFFKNEFSIPIERNNDIVKQNKLKTLINPFILRRTKGEVAKELPPLTEKVHFCEMSEYQKNIYEEKKSEIRNVILESIDKNGFQKSKFVVLSGLMKLRLIANHPVLSIKDYVYDSGKFTEIIRNVENLQESGHKVLLFSQFVKHLKLFKDYFDSHKMIYSMLSGEMDQKTRIRVIDDFQTNPNNKLFLISLKAGGVGLNLTSADYVFMLDPWWNPAVEKQAINRAHRIGQDKPVFTYKYISKDTIEEKMLALQEKKSLLADTFLSDMNGFNKLTFEEIQTFLS
ncbi:MAG: DEAD/DEAH box helicase family protein [Bacteroidetes bacterium]|nr:DEAD/DEAH box helicase family protein [Bacteroidota bacterium]